MSIYPENPLFKSLSASAYSMGKSLGSTPRRRGPIDLSQFKNVQQATTQATAPSNIYKKFLAAGTETVPYGGSTKFENVHPGIDVANKEGTPIPAFYGGTVTEVQRGQQPGGTGFGNYVKIVDNQNREWRFSHLRNTFVRTGQQVTPGSILGTMGHTGSVYSNSGGLGTHSDIRVRDAYGKYVDPSLFLS